MLLSFLLDDLIDLGSDVVLENGPELVRVLDILNVSDQGNLEDVAVIASHDSAKHVSCSWQEHIDVIASDPTEVVSLLWTWHVGVDE